MGATDNKSKDIKLNETVEEIVPSGETGANQLADYDDEGSEDSLTFSNGVIEKIVALSLDGVPNIVCMKGNLLNKVQDAFGMHDMRQGISVTVTPDGAVRISIAIIMAYGAYAPDIFDDVKKTAVKAITTMTGLEVDGVHLRVEDVYTPDEIEAYQAKMPAAATAGELPEGQSDADESDVAVD